MKKNLSCGQKKRIFLVKFVILEKKISSLPLPKKLKRVYAQTHMYYL